jgi:peroxiredoxin
MVKRVVISVLLLLPVLSFSAPVGWTKEGTPVRVGDPFPPFVLKNNLTATETGALRLPAKETISLNDFTSDIILIELLNVYCHTCQLQVPVFNQLWDKVQSDKILKSKVTILGITVGNNSKEINKFQKNFKAHYPILADPSKEVFNNSGNLKGTPQTYLLKKGPSGKWFILYHHRGAVDSYEFYLRKIKELFKQDLEGVDPGYIIPKSFLTTLKSRYAEESFEKRRILIYFPSLTAFPLSEDIRNKDSQIKVLLSLITEENLAIVIAGFLNNIFSLKELEMLKKDPNIFPLEDGMGTLASQFEVSASPLILLVNDSNRIVFRADSLTRARADELLNGNAPQLKPALTEAELLGQIQKSMKEINSKIVRFEGKKLESGETIYLGFTNGIEEASLCGRVVSKYSICDVCHDIHYYYILDQNGYLVSFSPIHLTKYGNTTWNQNDIDKIKTRVLGKDIFKNLSFNPYVDAVTQATMSSYLIFEGLNEAKIVLKDFKYKGFRKEHWKDICLNNLCQIKRALATLKKKGITDSITLEDQTSLDMGKLKKHLLYQKLSKCPNKGKYLLIGEIPICATHGMNLKPCPAEPATK